MNDTNKKMPEHEPSFFVAVLLAVFMVSLVVYDAGILMFLWRWLVSPQVPGFELTSSTASAIVLMGNLLSNSSNGSSEKSTTDALFARMRSKLVKGGVIVAIAFALKSLNLL